MDNKTTSARIAVVHLCDGLVQEPRIAQSAVSPPTDSGRTKGLRSALTAVRNEPLRFGPGEIMRRVRRYAEEVLGRKLTDAEESLWKSIVAGGSFRQERSQFLEKAHCQQILDTIENCREPLEQQDVVFNAEEAENDAYWQGRLYEYEDGEPT